MAGRNETDFNILFAKKESLAITLRLYIETIGVTIPFDPVCWRIAYKLYNHSHKSTNKEWDTLIGLAGWLACDPLGGI